MVFAGRGNVASGTVQVRVGRRVWLAGFVALGGLSCAQPALAECTPDPATAGTTVICDGTDSDGFESGADNITVVINAGATVTRNLTSAFQGQETLLLEGDNVFLENNGTISRTGLFGGFSAVTLAGNGSEFVNNGPLLDSAQNSSPLWVSGDNVTVTNNSTISGLEHILVTGADVLFTNGPGATIAEDLVFRGDRATFNNLGLVDGSLDVQADDMRIFNGQMGEIDGIFATGSGGAAGLEIVNEGTIHINITTTGTYEDPVSIINEATGNIFGLTNAITADGGVRITNGGTIARIAGTTSNIGQTGLVRLRQGTSLVNESTGVISTEGLPTYFAFAVNGEMSAPNAYAGILTNAGTITGLVGAVGGTFVGGTIVNTGTIESLDQNGFATSPVGFVVPAFHKGGAINVLAGDMQIVNEGTLSAVQTALAVIGKNVVVTNSGTITVSAGTGAVAVMLAGDSSHAAMPAGGPGTVTLINEAAGTIEASGPDGVAVSVASDGTVSTRIENRGTVTAPGTGILGSDMAEDVLNSGTITGAVDLQGGADTFRNTGLVDGDVLMGDGDDSYEQGGAALVTGKLSGGAGFDFAKFTGLSGSLDPFDVTGFEEIALFVTGSAVLAPGAQFETGANVTVSGGTLSLDGTTLRSSLTVSPGATLAGSGSIGGHLAVSGTLAPGGSLGSLTIAGDFSLEASSILRIDVDQAGTDLIAVGGMASLNGGTLVLEASATPPTSSAVFDIVTTGAGVLGSFSSVTFDGFTAQWSLIQTADSLLLHVLPAVGIDVPLSDNARATAIYLNRIIAAGINDPEADEIIVALFELGADGSALESALLSLQPEPHAAAAAINVEQAFLTGDIIRSRTSGLVHRARGVSLWLSGAGGAAGHDGSGPAGTSGFDVDAYGMVGGAEYVLEQGVFGTFVGYYAGEQTFDTLPAETTFDGIAIGGYGGWGRNGFSADAEFSYFTGGAETTRVVSLLGEAVDAAPDLAALSAQAHLAYDFTVGPFRAGPVAGATYIRSKRGAVTEEGGAAALSVAEGIDKFLFLDIAGRAHRSFAVSDRTRITGALTAGWRYEALDETPPRAVAVLSGTMSFPFATAAAGFDRSHVMLGGNVSALIGDRFEFFARYQGEFGETYTSSRFAAGLSLHF